MRAISFAELLSGLNRIDDELIVFVTEGEELSLLTVAIVVSFEAGEEGVNGYRYLLEVELIKDVIDVWSEWRNGQIPTLEEKLSAILHYTMHDATIQGLPPG